MAPWSRAGSGTLVKFELSGTSAATACSNTAACENPEPILPSDAMDDCYGDPSECYGETQWAYVEGRACDQGRGGSWYSFAAQAGWTYKLDTEQTPTLSGPVMTDSYMELLDVDGATSLASSDDAQAADAYHESPKDDGQGTDSYISWVCPATGTYFVVVAPLGSGGAGAYELGIKAVPCRECPPGRQGCGPPSGEGPAGACDGDGGACDDGPDLCALCGRRGLAPRP